MTSSPRNVAIFIFDDVEVLDFAGPYEVFNVASELVTPTPFKVYNVGLTHEPIHARGNLIVTPHYALGDAPQADILIIPGGYGTRRLLKNQVVSDWLNQQTEMLFSICTGALLLGAAGLLKDRDATTHHGSFDRLRAISPSTRVIEDQRFVQTSDKIITAGGISAGIDAALHIVERLLGPEALKSVTDEMEYQWHLKLPL